MEKSAKTISNRKFAKLAIAHQHRLLNQLSLEACGGDDPCNAITAYERLLHESELDRPIVPIHLDHVEAWQQRAAFHALFFHEDLLMPNRELHHTAWQSTHSIHLVLEGIRSPYNLGSMLRLADNFGLEAVWSDSPHPKPNHPQCAKAARGSESWIPFGVLKDLPDWLRATGRPTVVLELGSTAKPLAKWSPPPSFNLVVGNEANGVSKTIRDLADEQVYIPMKGQKRSMNVSHAVASLLTWATLQSKNG